MVLVSDGTTSKNEKRDNPNDISLDLDDDVAQPRKRLKKGADIEKSAVFDLTEELDEELKEIQQSDEEHTDQLDEQTIVEMDDDTLKQECEGKVVSNSSSC